MKAWDEILADPDMTVCETSYSQWYLDFGVKIERFHDGKIEIKNTMLSPDHYRDVTERQRDVFESHGWQIGAISVCIDTYTTAAERLNARIRSCVNNNNLSDLEDYKRRRDKLLKKIGKYDRRLNKLFLDL